MPGSLSVNRTGTPLHVRMKKQTNHKNPTTASVTSQQRPSLLRCTEEATLLVASSCLHFILGTGRVCKSGEVCAEFYCSKTGVGWGLQSP